MREINSKDNISNNIAQDESVRESTMLQNSMIALDIILEDLDEKNESI